MSYYITGDIHGSVLDLSCRIKENSIKQGDCLIILGDACFNYFGTLQDTILKTKANNLGVTLFCIHGNHEIRPENMKYKETIWNGRKVWYEPDFPNLLFAVDGEVYNIDGNKTLVIGGAYSVDKYYRAARCYMNYKSLIPAFIYKKLLELAQGSQDVTVEDKKVVDDFLVSKQGIPTGNYGWWTDEQISEKNREKIETLIKENNMFDIVLSHTCPERYEPTEVFIKGIRQDMVDRSMEKWLNEIENKIKYKKWYAGHFHVDKDLKNGFEFLYKKVVPLTNNKNEI